MINKDEQFKENKKIRLAISGGGAKGYSLIGCFKAFEEYNIEVTEYIASSIGSFFCCLHSIGYTSSELKEVFLTINLSNCNLNIASDDFFTHYGIYDHKVLQYVLEEFLKGKNLNENITLKEHFVLTNKLFTSTGTCVEDKDVKYFSKDSDPDMKLIDAVLISTSYPLVYVPVIYNGKKYIDGGCADNFPIHFLRETAKDDNITQDIMGILLRSTSIDRKTYNLFEYTCRILEIVYRSRDDMIAKIYKENTIVIETDFITTLSFELDKEKIERAVQTGYEKTVQFLDYKNKQ